MVKSEVSPRRIRGYLHRWSTWWVGTAQSWQYHEPLEWFLHVCWDLTPARYAIGLLHQFTTKAEPHDQAPVPVFVNKDVALRLNFSSCQCTSILTHRIRGLSSVIAHAIRAFLLRQTYCHTLLI